MANTSSRILALATVATVATVAAVSGVLAGSWSKDPIVGQDCQLLTTDKYGYGYGYQGATGYGYDCSPKAPTNWSGNSGGGGSVYSPDVNTGNTTNVDPKPNVVLFPNFTKACGQEATTLTDSKVLSYYDVLQIQNRVNAESRNLTRAEFLKLVLNAAKVDVTKESAPTYSDVPADHTLAQYIAYATRMNIVSGQDNKFRPNDSISRGEAMKVLVNATKLDRATEIKSFTDVTPSYSLATYVQTAKDNCIVQGATATTFEPLRGITVAETAKVLYNMSFTK